MSPPLPSPYPRLLLFVSRMDARTTTENRSAADWLQLPVHPDEETPLSAYEVLSQGILSYKHRMGETSRMYLPPLSKKCPKHQRAASKTLRALPDRRRKLPVLLFFPLCSCPDMRAVLVQSSR